MLIADFYSSIPVAENKKYHSNQHRGTPPRWFLFQDFSVKKRLLAAFIITTIFMFVEAIGGWLSGSLALLADAGHMLTDTVSLLMALLAAGFSGRLPNNRHTFGYLRLTTLAAFLNAFALLLITVIIFWEAALRLLSPQPIENCTMLFIAIAGLMVNIIACWMLHSGSRCEKNINLRAAALHVWGDLLGSVGAIIAALVMLYTNWLRIDPLLSITVSFLVLRSAWRLLRESFHELLEGTPQQFDIEKLKCEIAHNIPDVYNVHHVHLWQVGKQVFITLHVQIILICDQEKLLHCIQDYLLNHYCIGHATIQIESKGCEIDTCARPCCY